MVLRSTSSSQTGLDAIFHLQLTSWVISANYFLSQSLIWSTIKKGGNLPHRNVVRTQVHAYACADKLLSMISGTQYTSIDRLLPFLIKEGQTAPKSDHTQNWPKLELFQTQMCPLSRFISFQLHWQHNFKDLNGQSPSDLLILLC